MDALATKTETNKRKVVEAIISYQSKHPGWSPSDDLLSRETQLPVNEVKYLISVLEKDGVVGVVGKWPRQLWVTKPEEYLKPAAAPTGTLADVMPKEVKEMPVPTETVRVRTQHGKQVPYMLFPKRAKLIAEAIDKLRAEVRSGKRKKVLVKDIAEITYGTDATGQTSVVIARMVDEGWVKHGFKKHGDIALTALGREKLLGEAPKPKPEPTWPNTPVAEIEEEAPAFAAHERELDTLAKMPDEQIDTSDIPETTDWDAARDARRERMGLATMAVSPEAYSNMRVELRKAQNRVLELETQLAEAAKLPLQASEELLQRIDNIVANGRNAKALSDEELVLECVNRGFTISKR